MKLYTCCPNADCKDYRNGFNFLRDWGIEPAIEFDDDHFFEYSIPDYWSETKRTDFFKAIILKTSMPICFCGEWEDGVLESLSCNTCNHPVDVHTECIDLWEDWFVEVGCQNCARKGK